MKDKVKKIMPKKMLNYVYGVYHKEQLKNLLSSDLSKFKKYSFGINNNINTLEQLEARLTKAYHSIEKGLSYKEIRMGFGKTALEDLISIMKLYKTLDYPRNRECYKTAMSNLHKYIKLHEKNNYDVEKLKSIVKELGDEYNELGGVYEIKKEQILTSIGKDFKEFSNSRHSVRDYSMESVSQEIISNAINLAQNAPSACNRQAWKVRVIDDATLKKVVQNNQNGNKGFGDGIDKFILVTSDYQYYSKPRERNQAQIDGGMYAMNLIYSLHYYGVATIPLSASLSLEQESNLRRSLSIEESELFVLFIGIGNYTDDEIFKVPKSTRREPNAIYI